MLFGASVLFLGFGALGFEDGRPHDGMAEVPAKVFVATIESLRRPRIARMPRAEPPDSPVRNHL
jgi:hypothetical protein